jgi:hypothetical protein
MVPDCPRRIARVYSGFNFPILYLTELGNFAAIPARVLANIQIWYTEMNRSSFLLLGRLDVYMAGLTIRELGGTR